MPKPFDLFEAELRHTQSSLVEPLLIPRQETSCMSTCTRRDTGPLNQRHRGVFRQGRIGDEVVSGTDPDDAAANNDYVAGDGAACGRGRHGVEMRCAARVKLLPLKCAGRSVSRLRWIPQ